MKGSTIICETTKQFYDTIAELTYRGLTFKADAHNLTITL